MYMSSSYDLRTLRGGAGSAMGIGGSNTAIDKFLSYVCRGRPSPQRILVCFLVIVGGVMIVANLIMLGSLSGASSSDSASLDKDTHAYQPLKHIDSDLSKHPHKSKLVQEHRQHDHQVDTSSKKLETPPPLSSPLSSSQSLSSSPSPVSSSETESKRVHLWSKPAENDCDRQFGNGFSQRVNLCAQPTYTSGVTCWRNRAMEGMVCEGTNIGIDISRIEVSDGGESIESVRGRSEDVEFPKYSPGALSIGCSSPSSTQDIVTRDAFPHHLFNMFSSVSYESNMDTCTSFIDEPVLLVTRYEYANVYHTMGDWYNTYQTLYMFNITSTAPFKIIFMDGHSSGSLDSIWDALFGRDNIYYIKHLSKKLNAEKLCFKRALFVSPAYQSGLGVVAMRAAYDGCVGHPLLADFSNYFNSAYQGQFDTILTDVKDVFGNLIIDTSDEANNKKMLATIILRRDYLAHPRLASITASRKISNEKEVFDATNTIPGVRAVAVDFALLSVAQQIALIHHSDFLIGIHGAALSYSILLRPFCGLVELIPTEYLVRPHFRYFALWADRPYFPLILHKTDPSTNQHYVDIPPYISHLKQSITQIQSLRPLEPITSSSTSSNSDSSSSSVSLPLVNTGPPGQNGHRLCILVPFRDSSSPTSQGANRTANLKEFIPYMINHLTKTGKRPYQDFEIIVVEQTQGHVFNKGALFNAGYKLSKSICDYICLHDVDQVPLSLQNTYSYPSQPTHLCTASSQFGFKMAYPQMVGGAMLMTNSQYELLNGYSNFYWGWGQEDDDFYYRLTRKIGGFDRLEYEQGKYQALAHPRVMDLDVTPVFNKGTQHLTETRLGTFDISTDGLSNLKFKVKKLESPRAGYRHALVQLLFDDMPEDLNGKSRTENDNEAK